MSVAAEPNRRLRSMRGVDARTGGLKIAGKITPNPGGVGPMTIAMLMSNTVRAAEMTLR